MALELLNKPIPWDPHSRTALDYKNVGVDLSDPRSGEVLVDLSEWGIAGHGYYSRTDGLNAPYYRRFAAALERVWCRRSVAERLTKANERLSPLGVEIFVLNGYRPLALQRELWAFYIKQAGERLDNPTEADCVAFAGEYCSDPRAFDEADSRTWPTHITGGAVDVTLRVEHTGELLFMGGVFDDPAELSHTAYFEKLGTGHQAGQERISLSQSEALRNRRLLYWAMTEAGFANYPFEWWHFDWGTQFWVINCRCSDESARPKRAWYGPARRS